MSKKIKYPLPTLTTALFILIIPYFILNPELKNHTFFETPGPSSTPVINSIFKNDTCSPPCWFKLIPGKSLSADVVEVLLQNQDKFFVGGLQDSSPQRTKATLEPVIHGFYSFYWKDWSRPAPPIDNVIVVNQNRLVWMRIMAPDTITLNMTLAEFGQPNSVRLTAGIYDFTLALFYKDLHIVVIVSAANDQCNMNKWLEDYELNLIYYYDLDQFKQFESDQLLDEWLILPQEVWEKWFSSKVKGSCADAISEVVTNIVATATQSADATRAAAATQTAAPTALAQSPIPTTTPNSK